MTNTIELENVQIFAYHGCIEEEALIGAWYRVDMSIETDFMEGAREDLIDKTLNYVLVNDIVREQMAIRSRIIENVALRIVGKVRESFPAIKRVRIRIAKQNPPVAGQVGAMAVVIDDK